MTKAQQDGVVKLVVDQKFLQQLVFVDLNVDGIPKRERLQLQMPSPGITPPDPSSV